MTRVPYVSEDDLEPEYRDLVVSSLQPGKTLNVYSALGNNQEVLYGFREFLAALWNHSGLTDRHREIVILTVASETKSEYEWHQHENIASGSFLDSLEISAIARDNRDPFSEAEQALIAYTRAVSRGRVTDSLHATAQRYFDDATLVGTISLTVGYFALSLAIDALCIDIESGEEFVGWDLD